MWRVIGLATALVAGAVAVVSLQDEPCGEPVPLSCRTLVRHEGLLYQPKPLARPLPPRLLGEVVESARAGCSKMPAMEGDADSCERSRDVPDTPTQVRRVVGYDDELLVWPDATDPRPVFLVPLERMTDLAVMSRRVEDLVNRYRWAPVPLDDIQRPRRARLAR